MKYGRWKREAKRLRAEYASKNLRPIRARAFVLPDDDPTDASRMIQQAIDFAEHGTGGTVYLEKGIYPVKHSIRFRLTQEDR